MPFPVSDGAITHAEKLLGRTLPAVLRTRLSVDNGGEIECEDATWWLYPVWDDTNRSTISRTASHIVAETELWRQWTGFPADAIVIAHDGNGNALILRGSSDRVEEWDHQTRVCRPVTPSFATPLR